jgi:predicted transposase/invertase (TIGR01784 family)
MIPNPHDALFKAVFGQPEHARGALRAVMPPVLAEALDWSALSLRPGSFVDPALSSQHTDLLYSTKWRDGDEAFVYFLFEHQSAPPADGMMVFRLLRYKVRIWDSWRADHPKAKTLPMIMPIVMYHGLTHWSDARTFHSLLEVPAGLRPAVEPYLVGFTYVLHDLSEIPDDRLRDGAMTALAKLVAMCFKHARKNADFVGILGRWMDIMRDVAAAPNGLAALAQVMRYILHVNEHIEPEALQALLEREIGPKAKDAVMTAGERLIEQGIKQGIGQGIQQGIQQGLEQGIQKGIEQGIQQGIQQGIEQGIEQGIQQGRQEAFQELVLHMLRQRFGDEVNARVEQRITTAPIEKLELWSGRVLSAATLTELFAD